MKVLVVGAHGQVGSILTDLLHESPEHSVRAVVRKEEQCNELESRGIEAFLANLEGPVAALEKSMDGVDAVVFTAGSGGKTGDDKTLLIDLDGAVKVMEAAKQAGVKRFVMVSAMQAHHRENWSEAIKPYYVAKHYADRILQQIGLDYTIVRPGALLNEPGTGKVQVAENLPGGSISREDVARVLVAVLENSQTTNREFDLMSGDSPIEEALKSL